MKFLEELIKDFLGSVAVLMPVDLVKGLGVFTEEELKIKSNIDRCNALVPSYPDPSYNDRFSEVNNFFVLIRIQLKRYNGYFKQYFNQRFDELKEKDKFALGF